MAAELRLLSDTQLMQEYDDPGHFVSLAPYHNLAHAMPAMIGPGESDSPYTLKLLEFGDVKREILRRGAPMVPLLAAFLSKELPKRRLAPTPAMSNVGCWYDTETTDLLAQIRDPSAAQALLTILTGDGRKPAFDDGYAAEQALETLTRCCFYKSLDISSIDAGQSVPRLGAARARPRSSQDADFEAAAAFYRQWLAGEGKDAVQWLPLARRRAHLLLATDDPISIYDAALFLTSTDPNLGFGQQAVLHDDTPEATLKRLQEIATQVGQEGKEVVYGTVTRPKYFYKDQPIPSEIGDLSRFALSYSRFLQARSLQQ